jgi:predicted 3-demethylubiquinone-9 3-methyltransferase (glyoxalase superfamily)
MASQRVSSSSAAMVTSLRPPAFTPNEAVSFQVMTDDQAETDRYWNAIIENDLSPLDAPKPPFRPRLILP